MDQKSINKTKTEGTASPEVQASPEAALRDEVRAYAHRKMADLVSFASRERFEGLDPRYNPLSIFPEANTVILLGRRINRGSLRGIEEGTNFGDYGSFGYRWLDDEF
ncbi:MAG: hypothetical protein PHG48_05565, partial [Eubacteriales bacterium]|nr:hypothetical protein [Eubacteriales bacterium]